MSSRISLDNLWKSTKPSDQVFEPEGILHLPDPAIRYLQHAIKPGGPLATAVRLRMHGEIKLRNWSSFKAEQLIHLERGMIWRATAWMSGIPIRGKDSIIDGEGRMIWRLLGIIPIIKASGPDISKSAAGRLQGEFVWLPSRLAMGDIEWSDQDSLHAKAKISVAGVTETITLLLTEEGRLVALSLSRWGNPEGNSFGRYQFGAEFEEERTFGAYTIPTRFKAGWHYGSDLFEKKGEFFRCIIDEAEFR
jgi:hypothetical protein